jgi:mono/diheme cytochrome c family protein/glucose/arabinose dehydrogenase
MNHRSVFLLFTLAASLAIATRAEAQMGDTPGEGAQTPQPAGRKIERAPVLTPEAEFKTFQIVPGFRIELVAAEPMVHDPVGATYDHDGNLWVVEMTPFNAGLVKDYPQLAGGATTVPDGKIVKLESTHHDGHYDRRTVWLGGLNAPRVISIMKDGVLVGDPPRLWLTRDLHHTGHADDKVLLSEGYGVPGSEEGSANGLLWGRDNLLHNISFEFDYRYAHGTIQKLPLQVRGQFGLAQDDYGRFYFSRNSDQLRADLYSPQYNLRNPNVTELPWANVRVPVSQEVWPSHQTPALNRAYRKGILGQQTGGLRPDGTLLEFTAACSSQVYRGRNFPDRFYGNAFVPEPGANLIKRDILAESQGQVTALNAYEGREFMTSTDPRFRPVALTNAPDGTLLVSDMYRGILEEYHILTSYLRDQSIARGLTEDQYGHGRLWRISYVGGPLDQTVPHLDSLSAPELVALLAKPNAWWRDTAQQMIVERGDRSAVDPLREAALHAADPVTRVYALWTLDGLEATDLPFLARALGDASPKVRSVAVRLHERFLKGPSSGAALAQLTPVLHDPEPEVSVQLALSVGEVTSAPTSAETAAALHLLQQILMISGDHPYIPKAIASGLRSHEFEFLNLITADLNDSGARPEIAATLTVLSSAVVHEAVPAQVTDLLAQVTDDGRLPHWARLAVLSGFDALSRPAFRRTIGATRIVKATSLAPAAASADPEIREHAARLVQKLRDADLELSQRAQGHILTAAERPLYEEGKTTYQICSACHQLNGAGLTNVAPSLVDSHWVTAAPGLLVRILLNGKEGTPGFPGAMPALGGAFSDRQLAGVLTYVRNSWGLQAGAVTPELVTALRARYGKRTGAWTDNELSRAEPHLSAVEVAAARAEHGASAAK